MANQISNEKRAQILSLLCEGVGINAPTRITSASKNTVLKLLADAGEACAKYQDEAMQNLKCKRVECDEIWSFVGMKQKNIPEELQGTFGLGEPLYAPHQRIQQEAGKSHARDQPVFHVLQLLQDS